MYHPNKFSKQERLCGEIRIGRLFAEGHAFIAYPLRVVFKSWDEKSDSPLKVLFSVPKKRLKKAVRRNRVKRLMREAYRLNKHLLQAQYAKQNRTLHIAFTYLSEEPSEYSLIEIKIKYALNKILQYPEP